MKKLTTLVVVAAALVLSEAVVWAQAPIQRRIPYQIVPVPSVPQSGVPMATLVSPCTSGQVMIDNGQADNRFMCADMTGGSGGGGAAATADIVVEQIGSVLSPTALPGTRVWVASGITIPEGVHAILLDASAVTDDYHFVDWDTILTKTAGPIGSVSAPGQFETFESSTGLAHVIRLGHDGSRQLLVANDTTTAFTLPALRVERILAPPGPRGAQGDPGAAGARGTDGADGQDGTDGQDGAQGPRGFQGIPGEDGNDGADGARGLSGSDGQDGARGPIGPTGPVGPAGPAGADGTGTVVAANPSGTDGADLNRIAIGGTNYNVAGSGGGGGSGVTTFDALTDTPSSKTGRGRALVRVNPTGTALQYIDEPTPPDPIPNVGRLPVASATSADLVFLSHDYTEGTKQNATVTVGFSDGVAGYGGPRTDPPNIGRISSPGPGALDGVIGVGTSSSYDLHDVYSFNRDWLAAFTMVEIAGTQHALGDTLHERGIYFRRITNGPENLSASTFTLNFLRSDGTWAYTDATTETRKAGLWEKLVTGSNYRYDRLTSAGLVHVDGIGAPTEPPVAAAQSYVDDLGRLWVAGDRVEYFQGVGTIGADVFSYRFGNSEKYIADPDFVRLIAGGNGAFALAAAEDTFVQLRGTVIGDVTFGLSWVEVWTYIVSNLENTATTRGYRDDVTYLGKFGDEEEAVLELEENLESDTFEANAFVFAYTADNTVRTILNYTAGLVAREDHFSWRGPLTSEEDVADIIEFNFKKYDAHSAPEFTPDFVGQGAINGRGEMWLSGSRPIRHQVDSIPNFTAASNVTVPEGGSPWACWRGAQEYELLLNTVCHFEFSLSNGTWYYRTSSSLQSGDFNSVAAWFRDNQSRATGAPAGLFPGSGGIAHPTWIHDGNYVFDDDLEAAAYVSAHHASTATTRSWVYFTGRSGRQNVGSWDLRYAPIGSFNAGTIVVDDEVVWTGPFQTEHAIDFEDIGNTPATISAGQCVKGNALGTRIEFGACGGTSGASDWIGLGDTPSSITGSECVRGNSAGTALEFFTCPTDGATGPAGADGTIVAANPGGTSGNDLTRISIAGTNYNIVGGGGGGGGNYNLIYENTDANLNSNITLTQSVSSCTSLLVQAENGGNTLFTYEDIVVSELVKNTTDRHYINTARNIQIRYVDDTTLGITGAATTQQVLRVWCVNYGGSSGGNAFDLHDDVSASGTTISADDRVLYSDESASGDPNEYITAQNFLFSLRDFAAAQTVIADTDRIFTSDESATGDPIEYVTLSTMRNSISQIWARTGDTSLIPDAKLAGSIARDSEAALSTTVRTIVTLTQTAYDALTPNSNTLYFITGP